MSTPIHVGIDVSKGKVAVCILPQDERFEVPEEKYGQLAKKLIRLEPELVVMEATGGYERPLRLKLLKYGLPVAVVNPRQVRDYAKALGVLAKTDSIDSFIIARFAKDVQPTPNRNESEEHQVLRELLARRRQLVSMRTSESNRRHQAVSKRVSCSIKESITHLNRQLRLLEQEIDTFIKKLPDWQEKEEILRSAPGVGEQTFRTLASELPELGELSREEIASLVGIAPLNRDSGKYHGRRHIRGGRIGVRNALYMACITAIRKNPVIRVFYERLRGCGKQFKVALTACMRKLLTILNAMVKQKRKFSADGV